MPRPSRRASKTILDMGRRSKHEDETSADELETDSAPQVKYPRTGKRGAPQVFPRKLYEILQNESGDVIAWTESGKSFVIKDMDIFVMNVLMKYFRHQKYSSFQRQLNLYGFRKISKGAETGAYCHEHFLRDQHDKLRLVRRTPQASTRSTQAKDSKDSKRSYATMTKASRALPRFPSEEGIPTATAWRVDHHSKKVHTSQPGSLMDVETEPVDLPSSTNAAEELDKLESEQTPDAEVDFGVLEGRAIAHSPITSQPGLVVFDTKLVEDHRDLQASVTAELNDLSSSVNNLVLENTEPFEIPSLASMTSNPSDEAEAYLLDLLPSNPEGESRGQRFRSLSMSSDDWSQTFGQLPSQPLDQLGPIDFYFSDSPAPRPPVPVTMER